MRYTRLIIDIDIRPGSGKSDPYFQARYFSGESVIKMIYPTKGNPEPENKSDWLTDVDLDNKSHPLAKENINPDSDEESENVQKPVESRLAAPSSTESIIDEPEQSESLSIDQVDQESTAIPQQSKHLQADISSRPDRPGNKQGDSPSSELPLPLALHNAVRVACLGTGADYMSIALHYLTSFAAHVGQARYIKIGNQRHPLNLYALLVGKSGCGKGFSASQVEFIEQRAIAILKEKYNYQPPGSFSGLTSAEGLIERMQNPMNDKCDAPLPGKRMIIRESDYTGLLNMDKKPGNSFVRHLIEAYEANTLHSMKAINRTVIDPGISIIGHCTPERFLSYEKQFSMSSFMNRHLIFYTDPMLPGILPRQYTAEEEKQLSSWLVNCIAFARDVGNADSDSQEVIITESTRQFLDAQWNNRISTLEDTPALSNLLSWHRTIVYRLSALMALMDQTDRVTNQHVLMAYRLLDHSKSSLNRLLNKSSDHPEQSIKIMADKIFDELKTRGEGGLTKSDINNKVFFRNKRVCEIDQALDILLHSFPPKIEEFQSDKPGRGRIATSYRVINTKETK